MGRKKECCNLLVFAFVCLGISFIPSHDNLIDKYEVENTACANHQSCVEDENDIRTIQLITWNKQVYSKNDTISFKLLEDTSFNILSSSNKQLVVSQIDDIYTLRIDLSSEKESVSILTYNQINGSERTNFYFSKIPNSDLYYYSSFSFDDAEYQSFFYAYNNGLISQKEFDYLIEQYSKRTLIVYSNSKAFADLENNRGGYLHGRIKLTQKNGVSLYCPNVKIQLFSRTTLGELSLIAESYTNYNGAFFFFPTLSDLFTLKVLTMTSNDLVCSNSGEIPYVKSVNFSSANYWIENTVEIIDDGVTSDTFVRSMHILMGMYMTHSYGKYLNDGVDYDGALCRYPSNCSGLAEGEAHYHPDSGEIHISEFTSGVLPKVMKYQNMDVVCHEYGHHVVETFGFYPNLGALHYSKRPCYYSSDYYNDSNINISEYTNLQIISRSKKIAFSEAWATVIGIFSHHYSTPIMHLMRYTNDYYYSYKNYDDTDSTPSLGSYDDISNYSSILEYGGIFTQWNLSSFPNDANELNIERMLYLLINNDTYDIFPSLTLNDKILAGYCSDNVFTTMDELFNYIAPTVSDKALFGYYSGLMNTAPNEVSVNHHFCQYSDVSMQIIYRVGHISEYGPSSFNIHVYNSGGSYAFSTNRIPGVVVNNYIYGITIPLSAFVNYVPQCNSGAYVIIEPKQNYSNDINFVSQVFAL